jgi:hypothetical protein
MGLGTDKLKLNQGLLVDLSFSENVGTRVLDRAKPHHVFSMVGTPAWVTLASGMSVLDFSPNPDALLCAAAASLDVNFTSSDFSGAMWVYPDDVSVGNLIVRCSFDASGWLWQIASAIHRVYTFQASQHQSTTSASNSVIASVWQLLGFSRQGASVNLFINGGQSYSSVDSHIDPVTSPTSSLTIPINTGVNLYNGKMGRPRIWGRYLTFREHREIFNSERGWFGV